MWEKGRPPPQDKQGGTWGKVTDLPTIKAEGLPMQGETCGELMGGENSARWLCQGLRFLGQRSEWVKGTQWIRDVKGKAKREGRAPDIRGQGHEGGMGRTSPQRKKFR